MPQGEKESSEGNRGSHVSPAVKKSCMARFWALPSQHSVGGLERKWVYGFRKWKMYLGVPPYDSLIAYAITHRSVLTFIASLPSAMKMIPKCNSSTICPLLSTLIFCAWRTFPFSPLYIVSPVNYFISNQWKIINLNKLAKYLCLCICICLSPWICLWCQMLTNDDQ